MEDNKADAFGTAPLGFCCLPFDNDFLCFWCISGGLVDLHGPPMEITAPWEITAPSAPHRYSGTYSRWMVEPATCFQLSNFWCSIKHTKAHRKDV